MDNLGVVLNTLILANPYLDKSENSHFLLLQNLAIIGGLFYLLGQDNQSCPVKKSVEKTLSDPATLNTSSSSTTGKDSKRDKKKK